MSKTKTKQRSKRKQKTYQYINTMFLRVRMCCLTGIRYTSRCLNSFTLKITASTHGVELKLWMCNRMCNRMLKCKNFYQCFSDSLWLITLLYISLQLINHIDIIIVKHITLFGWENKSP